MARATYAELGDSCLTAHAMEVLGARWTYPIYRELVLGPKRFNDLLAGVPGITPAVLSSRLRAMESSGLVSSRTLSAPPSVHAYALTPWALELVPVLREVGRWAAASPARPDQGGMTPDAVVQAMVTMAGDRPLDPAIDAELRLVDMRVVGAAEQPYTLDWGALGMSARRGSSLSPHVTISVDSSRWGQVLFTALGLEQAGAQQVGDEAVAVRLVGEFRAVLDVSPDQGG